MIRIPVFRIFYSTTFTVLLLFTLALLAISPGDGVYQSFESGSFWNIIVIAAVYLLVILVTLFIYATRLYTTRTYLAAIPKFRLPLQKGDVPRAVRRLVFAGIDRSASIAFRVKPRDLTEQRKPTGSTDAPQARPKAAGLPPTWGNVSHPGWSAPHDVEAPRMNYDSVITELPHLLEAQAISLIPQYANAGIVARDDGDLNDDDSLPDPVLLASLQRPTAKPLRAYITQLLELGVLPNIKLATDFTTQYEAARFSSRTLTARAFHELMNSFAQILDSMQEPDLDAMEEASALGDPPSELVGNAVIQASGEKESRLEPRVARPVEARRDLSRGRLGPPPLDFSRHKPGPSTGQSHETANADASFSTPMIGTATPFFTPYPEPFSARTASTGSLAGSEGTAETAPSRWPRRGLAGNRTPSAYSRHSARPATAVRRTSEAADGLGLDLSSYDNRSQNELHDPTAADSENKAYDSPSLDSEDSEEEEVDEDGSVRKYSVESEARSANDDELSQVESIDSTTSVIRREDRKTQPGMLNLG